MFIVSDTVGNQKVSDDSQAPMVGSRSQITRGVIKGKERKTCHLRKLAIYWRKMGWLLPTLPFSLHRALENKTKTNKNN